MTDFGEWLQSEDGQKCMDTSILRCPDLGRQFLEYRLCWAFKAGMASASADPRATAGEQNSILQRGPDLARVAMPLVHLMNAASLSWADREAIATAIQLSIGMHTSMEHERQYLMGCAERAGKQ